MNIEQEIKPIYKPINSLYSVSLCLSLLTVSAAYAEDPLSKGNDSKPKEVTESSAVLKQDIKSKSAMVGAVKSDEQSLKTKKTLKRVVKPKKAGKSKLKKRRIRRFPTNRPKRALKSPPILGKIPFPIGEELTFKVNMLNAHSGTVTLKVGRRGKVKGQAVLELNGFVQSSPVLENFYPIRDSLRVLVDERSFLPVKSEFFLNEKGRKIEYISEFSQTSGRLDWTKVREVKGKRRTTNMSYMAPQQMHQT